MILIGDRVRDKRIFCFRFRRLIVRQVRAFFAIVAAAAAVPAVAQAPAQPQQQQQAAKQAPDDVICEKQLDTGSRLSTHKICRTRTQWAEILQDSRRDVERAQAQRAMSGN
jgi:hypothetical protein